MELTINLQYRKNSIEFISNCAIAFIRMNKKRSTVFTILLRLFLVEKAITSFVGILLISSSPVCRKSVEKRP